MIQQHNRFINQSVETLKQCLASLSQKAQGAQAPLHGSNQSIMSS